MKRVFLICLIFQFSNTIFSQIQYVDSLENILNTQEQVLSSEEKLQLHWDILSCYWNSDLDKAILYAKAGLKLSKKENNALWLSKFNRLLGFCYMQKGDFDSSLQHNENAVNYAIKAKDKKEENIAYIYIGNMYLRAGKHDLALKYYTDVLPSLESMQQAEHCANTLVNIAVIYQQQHNNEKALEYSKRSLAIAEKNNLVNAKMGNYGLIGDVLYETEQPDSAVVYLLKAYEMGHAQKNLHHVVACTQMLASSYSKLKDYRLAEKYAKECLEAANELGAEQDILIARSIMAKIYFDLGKYKECESYASQVWETDSTHLERAENTTALLCIANIFLDNPQKAIHFFYKYQLVRNQLSDKSLHNSLADMEVKYETEKKEMRISTLEKEKQFYIWLIVVGGLALLMLLGLLFYRHRLNIQKRKTAEQEREIACQKVKQLEQEKKLIATQAILDGETAERSRLARDLHDGLGGMLSVTRLNLEKEFNRLHDNEQKLVQQNKVMKMLDDSIVELRRIAHHMMPESLVHDGLRVSLEDFCHAIPNAHFQFIGKDSRLDPHLEVLIYRCTYELINNAVKYANASNIHAQLLIEEKIIALTVDDDGIGFDPDNIVSGTGLKNIRARVLAYNGKTTIRSAPGEGTKIIIEIESV